MYLLCRMEEQLWLTGMTHTFNLPSATYNYARHSLATMEPEMGSAPIVGTVRSLGSFTNKRGNRSI
ncbi:hypothetical protein FRC08_013666 [Ceratobasidium sp. 394]|nr:hypothetical protein FRC08_013666 [Ceratobasidium sp. 394]